jgi:hypothetical protein
LEGIDLLSWGFGDTEEKTKLWFSKLSNLVDQRKKWNVFSVESTIERVDSVDEKAINCHSNSDIACPGQHHHEMKKFGQVMDHVDEISKTERKNKANENKKGRPSHTRCTFLR